MLLGTPDRYPEQHGLCMSAWTGLSTHLISPEMAAESSMYLSLSAAHA